MGDVVALSTHVAIPTAALILGLVLLADKPSVLAMVGATLWVWNGALSWHTHHSLQVSMGMDSKRSLGEAWRHPMNVVLVLLFVWVAAPIAGWLIVIPVIALMGASLTGDARKMGVHGLTALCCVVLGLHGVPPQQILICAASCVGIGVVLLACNSRLGEGRAQLGEVIEDVVAREREHGKALLSAQRSSRLASVGQLAAGVAHEINNPLTYIISNMEYILEYERKLMECLPKEDAQPLIESAQDVLEGAHRVRRIVHGIKLFARLDQEVQIAAVDVNEVLASSLDMARNEIRHRATLVTDFAEQLPTIQADKGRLGQVFINLLINASQALPDEPESGHEQTITVSTSLDEEGFIVATVADTGVGIETEKMSQIFEPFYTSKPVGEGTGLGLPIVHGIVSDLGGHIHVSSKVGVGTTFSVHLPTSADGDEELERTSEYAAAPKEEPPGRILIIDDEALVAKSLARIIKDADSTAVNGGESALALLREDSDFDVLFCDLMMPGLSGPKFYEVLQAEFPQLAKRVIFITGGVFSDVTQTFLDESPVSCLYKPFSLVDVKKAIARLPGRQTN